jgi:hypothetical protein
MPLHDNVNSLIERSSMGSPVVRRLRAKTPRDVVAGILAAVARISSWDERRDVHNSGYERHHAAPPAGGVTTRVSDAHARTTSRKGGESHMPKQQPLRPGKPAPMSGIYQRPDGEQVVSTQGHPMPPGPKGTTYKPVKPAIHKG